MSKKRDYKCPDCYDKEQTIKRLRDKVNYLQVRVRELMKEVRELRLK